VIKNKFVDGILELTRNNADPWEIMKSGVGKIREAYVEGNIEGGSMAFGQVCGLIQEIPTCQELIHTIITDAENVLKSIDSKICA
jgi:enoyl-[acyl-carrier protein] reductase II